MATWKIILVLSSSLVLAADPPAGDRAAAYQATGTAKAETATHHTKLAEEAEDALAKEQAKDKPDAARVKELKTEIEERYAMAKAYDGLAKQDMSRAASMRDFDAAAGAIDKQLQSGKTNTAALENSKVFRDNGTAPRQLTDNTGRSYDYLGNTDGQTPVYKSADGHVLTGEHGADGRFGVRGGPGESYTYDPKQVVDLRTQTTLGQDATGAYQYGAGEQTWARGALETYRSAGDALGAAWDQYRANPPVAQSAQSAQGASSSFARPFTGERGLAALEGSIDSPASSAVFDNPPPVVAAREMAPAPLAARQPAAAAPPPPAPATLTQQIDDGGRRLVNGTGALGRQVIEGSRAGTNTAIDFTATTTNEAIDLGNRIGVFPGWVVGPAQNTVNGAATAGRIVTNKVSGYAQTANDVMVVGGNALVGQGVGFLRWVGLP